jgi:hypothetical protein
MSMDAIRWAREVRHVTAAQKLVLLLLADSYNEGLEEAWPSAVSLAADAGLSDRAVRIALDALEAAGLITGAHHKWKATRWTLNFGVKVGPKPPPTPLNGVRPPTPERRSSPPCTTFSPPLNDVQTEPLITPIEPLEGEYTLVPSRAHAPADGADCVIPPAEEFFEAYPQKGGGPRAAGLAYAAAIKRGASHRQLMAALDRAVWPDDPRFIPYAQRWLDEERYRVKPQPKRFANAFMQLEYEARMADLTLEGPHDVH